VTGRVRLVGLVLSPQLVIDDGEHLTAVNANTLTIPAARLDNVPALVRDALAELQAQLDAGDTAAETGD
jgi:hypothetical protein